MLKGANVANLIAIAAKGKGYPAIVKRARAIGGRYGLGAAKMDRTLRLFVDILRKFECGATFPITASVLARHRRLIEKYQAQNIELAIHGLFHVDYSHLSLPVQKGHLARARQVFREKKVQTTGFRCPYLRWNDDTLAALMDNDLSYDSSQALHWDVVDGYPTDDYRHVLGFYRSRSAADYPALPKQIGKLVQIPYCLPDDEALIERLKLRDTRAMTDIWLAILERTYNLGELFTLGLHPERIRLLQEPLAAVLAQARHLTSRVWIARLDEITRWWVARSQATFEVTAREDGLYHLTVQGPSGSTVLARNVDLEATTEAWDDGFDRVLATSFQFRARERPFVGLSPGSDPGLSDFLRQQGYWVETGPEGQAYSIYLHQPSFAPEDERPLLKHLDQSAAPLIRLARWPNGAQSALCVTGDIDAMTLWDYGLRVIGR
jgi:peptidoglycan/xylan/chitin deacetylase (PgdA/CDA1 family)